MNDPAIFVGPVSTALGGADIAWIVGFVFAAVCYYIGARLGWAGEKESLPVPSSTSPPLVGPQEGV
jgi:purine-cytosine permease-like protein